MDTSERLPCSSWNSLAALAIRRNVKSLGSPLLVSSICRASASGIRMPVDFSSTIFSNGLIFIGGSLFGWLRSIDLLSGFQVHRLAALAIRVRRWSQHIAVIIAHVRLIQRDSFGGLLGQILAYITAIRTRQP